MIWTLLVLHLVIGLVLVVLGTRLRRSGLLVAAIPPAATTVWALTRLGGEPAEASISWVAALDLELAFRVDDLALMMTLLVSGIGVLVFVYAYGYFTPTSAGVAPFTVNLLAFSTAMLGLVWSDSVWSMFLFWELTSVTSFLLVGHKNTDPAVRAAARRALLITVAGGLCLLAGLVTLVDVTGTGRLSDMSPVDVTAATSAAAVLVLVAAATKSAQVPFHVWLPGAMAAPTPVSAYLHSATMVKAGVLLVAVGSPVFAGHSGWRTLGLVVGIASMLWGAVGALRHVDAKLILAWGTISQLGFMITLLAVGTAKAAFAGISILLAHAVFKAALFMVVGEVDVRTGTRKINELGGLASAMPVALVVAVVSGGSMAGVPPLLGFPAKEAALEAVLGFDGATVWLVGGAIVVGSIMTAAYTTRLLVGLFGPGPEVEIKPARWALTVPSAVLATITVVGYVALDGVNELVSPAAIRVDADADVYSLHRWPGLTTAFGLSVTVVTLGLAIGWLAYRRPLSVPDPIGARSVDQLIGGVVAGARKLTGKVQHGSLPVYVVTMTFVAALITFPFVVDIDIDRLYRWDNLTQAALAALVVVGAAVVVLIDDRLGVALALGIVGIAVSGLFVVHGAPDLALTQLLVETVVVAGFVLGLGHLARRFPPAGQQWRVIRVAVSGLAAAGVVAALAGAASSPSGQPPVAALNDQAVSEGGGNNVVNVILTDIRGLDTLGEVVVLAVVAVGVLALATAARFGEQA